VLVPLDHVISLGPNLQNFLPPGSGDNGWAGIAAAVWRYIVRPIAVGGNDGGRGVHAVRNGEQVDVEPGARHHRASAGRAADGIRRAPTEPIHERENRAVR